MSLLSNKGREIEITSLFNKRTIILGEVNRGKTFLLSLILKEILKLGMKSIVVVDMAPSRYAGIGGKMRVKDLPIRYYTTTIIPPRLTGKTMEEIRAFASENARKIEGLFERYLKNPSEILLINDVSIYLQAGDLDKLMEVVTVPSTLIMNGYYGKSLGGGTLGDRERENMDALIKKCDKVIKI